MTRIKNIPKRNNPLIKAIRSLLEHRAAWLYLLLDEAEKRGLQTEEFAKAAILRCGCFQGDRLRTGIRGNHRQWARQVPNQIQKIAVKEEKEP